MISDDEIHKAVDYLARSAKPAAVARANREYLTEYRKSLIAIIASEQNDGAETTRDRQARASKRYLDFLEGYKEAVRVDEEHRFLRAAAAAKIDAWQTWSANSRGKL